MLLKDKETGMLFDFQDVAGQFMLANKEDIDTERFEILDGEQ